MKNTNFIIFVLWVTLCVLPQYLCAQNPAVRIEVHFASDKYKLTATHKTTLDSIWQTVQMLPLNTIIIKGNTDSDGSDTYNTKLSQRRAEAVKAYLSTKNIENQLFQLDFFGENQPIEDNSQATGKQKNRRVEIYFFYTPAPPVVAPPIKKQPIVVKEQPKIDSTEIKRNAPKKTKSNEPFICSIDSLPHCKIDKDAACDDILISGDSIDLAKITFFKTFCTTETTESANIFTETTDGMPLISGGMFEIATENNKCFAKPIRILRPLPTDWQPEMKLWDFDTKTSRWKPSNDRFAVVIIKGVQYLEVTMRCPGCRNHDYKPCYEDIAVNMAAFSKITIQSVIVTYKERYGFGRYGFDTKKDEKRIKIPCYGVKKADVADLANTKIHYTVKGSDKKGNQYVLTTDSFKPFSNILAARRICYDKHGKMRKPRKLFGFIILYERGDTGRYTLSDADFKRVGR